MATEQRAKEEGQTKAQTPKQRRTELEQSTETSLPVRRESYATNPFSLMRRLSDEMDRLFTDFWGTSLGRRERGWPLAAEDTWWPQIEVSHRGDKLVVQADIPGMRKDDVRVEVRDNDLCISGERRSESEREEGGYYRNERSYGSFYRSVPLPRGAKPETASASFENGVLKIEIEAPQGSQGRRIEVREGSAH